MIENNDFFLHCKHEFKEIFKFDFSRHYSATPQMNVCLKNSLYSGGLNPVSVGHEYSTLTTIPQLLAE
jgi:hypothetical protein